MEEQYTQDTLKGSKGLMGMPVYSIAEGQNLGSVKNVVIDAKEKRVLALVVEKRRLAKDERLLPFEAVKSVGDDVVTVERGQVMERRNTDPAVTRALRRPVQPVGARCFTAGGKTMGKVDEYYFDVADGHIARLEISDGVLFKGKVLVDGQHIIALAPHTVMLADEALTMCRPVENNLLSSMELVRDKAADISRSTVSLLGNSLSRIKGGAAAEAPAPELAAEDEAAEAAVEEELAMAEQESTAAENIEEALLQAIENIEEAPPAAENIEAAQERPQMKLSDLQVEVLEPEEAPEAGQSVNISLTMMVAPPMDNEAADEAIE